MSPDDLNRRQILTLGALSTVGALIASTPTQAATIDSPDISHGSLSRPQVALTFHGAGANPIAQTLLKILKSTQTPVTVFAVGAWLKGDPTIAKQILQEGHDLGNHTMNHFQMKTLSASKVKSEISGCAKELTSLIGNHGSFFRPSGTQHSTALIRKVALANGYKNCISYDVDSHDYQDPGKAAVINNVMKSVKNGSIISLHFGHQDTVDALPTLIEKLHAQGLKPVTLTTLLGGL